MLNETIALYGIAILLHALAASAAWLAFLRTAFKAWSWLLVVGACLLFGLRSAVPFWVAINVGLYDFRDAIFSCSASALALGGLLALTRRCR